MCQCCDMDRNERIVLCDACGSEGRIYYGDPETGYVEECKWCEGTGGEIINTEPITEQDLIEMGKSLLDTL